MKQQTLETKVKASNKDLIMRGIGAILIAGAAYQFISDMSKYQPKHQFFQKETYDIIQPVKTANYMSKNKISNSYRV